VVAAVPVLAMAVQIMVQAGLVSSARDHFFLLFGWSFVVSILWAIFYAGYNYAVLRVLRNEPVSSDDFLRGVTRFPQLAVAGVLFCLGLVGLMVRRNILFVLMSLEVMMNATALAFVVAGSRWAQADGQIMFILVITLAAAEASIGLAILLQLYRRFHTLDIDAASEMRG